MEPQYMPEEKAVRLIEYVNDLSTKSGIGVDGILESLTPKKVMDLFDVGEDRASNTLERLRKNYTKMLSSSIDSAPRPPQASTARNPIPPSTSRRSKPPPPFFAAGARNKSGATLAPKNRPQTATLTKASRLPPPLKPNQPNLPNITNHPTSSPSPQPAPQPSPQPVAHPDVQPTRQTTPQPARQPARQPPRQPSRQPHRQPNVSRSAVSLTPPPGRQAGRERTADSAPSLELELEETPSPSRKRSRTRRDSSSSHTTEFRHHYEWPDTHSDGGYFSSTTSASRDHTPFYNGGLGDRYDLSRSTEAFRLQAQFYERECERLRKECDAWSEKYSKKEKEYNSTFAEKAVAERDVKHLEKEVKSLKDELALLKIENLHLRDDKTKHESTSSKYRSDAKTYQQQLFQERTAHQEEMSAAKEEIARLKGQLQASTGSSSANSDGNAGDSQSSFALAASLADGGDPESDAHMTVGQVTELTETLERAIAQDDLWLTKQIQGCPRCQRQLRRRMNLANSKPRTKYTIRLSEVQDVRDMKADFFKEPRDDAEDPVVSPTIHPASNKARMVLRSIPRKRYGK